MPTGVNNHSAEGPHQPATNPVPMRAADRRKLERAVAARERAERRLLEVVRECRDHDATVIEIAEVIGITRHGVYKMLKRAPED
jgi:hypothetical protein